MIALYAIKEHDHLPKMLLRENVMQVYLGKNGSDPRRTVRLYMTQVRGIYAL
jgi:hypothetical protein